MLYETRRIVKLWHFSYSRQRLTLLAHSRNSQGLMFTDHIPDVRQATNLLPNKPRWWHKHMSEPSQVSEFDCSLLRYVPNILSGEFLNIGLLMCDPTEGERGFADLRFRQDWSRVVQFDPDADVEVLAAVCTEMSMLLQDATDRTMVRRKLESSLSNTIQLSDRW